MSKKYLNIVKHYESCVEKHGDTFKGADWPNKDDAIIRYQVMLDVIKENEKVKLLDFGCGTGKLFEHILTNKEVYSHVDYSGLDISKKIMEKAKSKFPDTNFYCFDFLETDLNTIETFDYILLIGVFTEKIDLTFDEMWLYFKTLITKVFNKTNKGIAFNVMSKSVDWEREDLFHLSTDLLIDFITKKISRNFIIRNDYGLYEYTVYLYK